MQTNINPHKFVINDEAVMQSRKIRLELRPNREDMLRLYEIGHRPQAKDETVCNGQCLYCDSDGGEA